MGSKSSEVAIILFVEFGAIVCPMSFSYKFQDQHVNLCNIKVAGVLMMTGESPDQSGKYCHLNHTEFVHHEHIFPFIQVLRFLHIYHFHTEVSHFC